MQIYDVHRPAKYKKWKETTTISIFLSLHDMGKWTLDIFSVLTLSFETFEIGNTGEGNKYGRPLNADKISILQQ